MSHALAEGEPVNPGSYNDFVRRMEASGELVGSISFNAYSAILGKFQRELAARRGITVEEQHRGYTYDRSPVDYSYFPQPEKFEEPDIQVH